jgi:hypothetical protein
MPISGYSETFRGSISDDPPFKVARFRLALIQIAKIASFCVIPPSGGHVLD